MKSKICSKCKIKRPIIEFSKDKTRKDGYYPICKTCIRKYKLKNRKKILKQKLEHYRKNIKTYKANSKKWKDNHRLQIKEYNKIYRLNNKDKIKLSIKNWKIKNKEHSRIYYKNRRKEDINYRILTYLRTRIRVVLKKNKKSAKTKKLVGCSLEKLKRHLENQFKKGMAWKNHGRGWNGKGKIEWHIDHIKPCCKFNLSKVSEQQKCFYYKNLQPLWAEENQKKHAKYPFV